MMHRFMTVNLTKCKAIRSMSTSKIIQIHHNVTEPSSTPSTSTCTSPTLFSEIPTLTKPLQLSLSQTYKYSVMTPIQQRLLTLPFSEQQQQKPLCSNILLKAGTGTGKTLAYLLYAFSVSSFPVLILSPTRELASQITKDAKKLLSHSNKRVALFCGGVSKQGSLEAIKEEVDVIVATPGRLLDMLTSSSVLKRVAGCKVVVLDECDRLLDMGFSVDVKSILNCTGKEKQMVCVSATVCEETMKKVNEVCGEVLVIDCPSQASKEIIQSIVVLPIHKHVSFMNSFLEEHQHEKCIVFFATKSLTEWFSRLFVKYQPITIHGAMSQQQRSKMAQRFVNAENGVLFTTDVSARGVHYPNVDYVLQYGMPSTKECYTHRVGRTGRGGKHGKGILLVSMYEKKGIMGMNLGVRMLDGKSVDVCDEEKSKVNLKQGDNKDKADALVVYMSYYASMKGALGLSTPSFVEMVKEFGKEVLGMDRMPRLNKEVLKRVGLESVEEFGGMNDPKESKIGYMIGRKSLELNNVKKRVVIR